MIFEVSYTSRRYACRNDRRDLFLAEDARVLMRVPGVELFAAGPLAQTSRAG
ncbi:hypothetical protein [Quisquiliibacterium transsilvanicum]|uniref:Uncharacterized protein n=1 Tax=Quisquiliibacterium transsilvanicum TaxID=1549638 RepID=A0A7W8HG06_9BURK|nr:hypothetical protein [Quisquiliibacterium transsilvanicum]MBB5271248.1 hypothetical protein [Quisquiliibacterium transsilvanicum]